MYIFIIQCLSNNTIRCICFPNSSTPVQTLGLIVNNSMSGIRQFTPDESQFSLLRAPAAASKPNKYRNLYGLSPLSPSFGVLPLDSSPAEGYVISPSGTLPENDDQKIIPKRQLLGKLASIRYCKMFFFSRYVDPITEPMLHSAKRNHYAVTSCQASSVQPIW